MEEEDENIVVRAMIDIETLSTKNNALITEVGIYIFNNKGDLLIGSYWTPQWGDQILRRRHVDPKTLDWWDTQKTLPIQGMGSINEMFEEIRELCVDTYNVQEYWFRGPQFDAVKLESLAEDFGSEIPWEFWQVRDSRTLDIFNIKRPDKPEVKHTAMDDAEQQALDVMYILERVKVIEA